MTQISIVEYFRHIINDTFFDNYVIESDLFLRDMLVIAFIILFAFVFFKAVLFIIDLFGG